MNNIYIYDGSFISLMSLIVVLINLKKEPVNIISEKNYIPNLLDEVVNLKINNKKEKIKYLLSKTSKKIIITCYYSYLSTNNNKEMLIYDFIKNALVYKDTIFYRRNINSVNEILKMRKRVSRESHSLKGFLRFKKMKNDFYYAKINPTNNVIYLITNHFKERLKNEYFVINDVNRSIYAFYDKNKVTYANKEDIIKLNLNIDKEEENIEDLWISFFKTISIKERSNLKCQMNHMPKKYWDYIIEMEVE